MGRLILTFADANVRVGPLGRLLAGRPDLREIVLRVLNASYILQYRLEGDRIIMLRAFHGRERR
ncbi:hypothetical protein BLTE_19440 [Blastochloris tepida]|uniref:Type II toxin-antitoxin system RelE/ParE family toxin n=1 Tax=Blastochloris tepida TaxID=2233851 RepID=A0A348G126_9HYPH|nr:hypothetical protein BLTE_19440 [Blastochloris tepida]